MPYEQIAAVRPSVETIALLAPTAMRRLADELGVRFTAEAEFPEAGPTRWAALRLPDGSEGLIGPHYEHPSGAVAPRPRPGADPPATAVERLRRAPGIPAAAVEWVADRWPVAPTPEAGAPPVSG